MITLKRLAPGLGLVLAISIIAVVLGTYFPIVGGPVFGLLFGLLLNNTVGKPQSTLNGVKFSSKKILQWSVIIIGCNLSLASVWSTGVESLAVLLSSLLAAFLAAYFFGKLLNIPSRLKILIGVGTAICGGSAIAATSPVIEAEETEIAYSISTIFMFNIAAVLLFPFIGHLLGLSDTGFGLWAGTAINDTSSVVAAGYLYSNEAGDYATIVKLVRTTFIIPITFFLAMYYARKKKKQQQVEGNSETYKLSKVFPWFIVWFLVASLMNTLGLFSESVLAFTGEASKFMIVMALTAIGLSANLKAMLKTGVRPLIFGLSVWFSVATVSLIVQSLCAQL
ncbi:YeiH family protein [Paenibacillus marinisediminis]